MGNHRFLSLPILCLMALGELNAADKLTLPVPELYRRIAWGNRVPPEMLFAIALAESARSSPQGERPWPWSINVAGRSYRYSTRLEAWKALQKFVKYHPLKRIDVGIAQVNLGWNGQRFTSTWQAFDPYTNLQSAAQILRKCYDLKPGSWMDASGCYHHPAGGKPANRYKTIITQKLESLDSEAISYQVYYRPQASFVWVEPRRLQ
jgi:hypothetical protein